MLTPLFARLPQAHAGLMGGILGEYRRIAELAGSEPDEQLMAPVLAVFALMQPESPE